MNNGFPLCLKHELKIPLMEVYFQESFGYNMHHMFLLSSYLIFFNGVYKCLLTQLHFFCFRNMLHINIFYFLLYQYLF